MQILESLLTGSVAAAVVTAIFSIVFYKIKRKDEKKDKESAVRRALRYIMLYIIQERCKDYIAAGEITVDELRSLHQWHDVYHNGLDGNGDADGLIHRVENEVKIITD